MRGSALLGMQAFRKSGEPICQGVNFATPTDFGTIHKQKKLVFTEFLAGHFDNLMRMLEYVQSIHPDVNISKERARQIFGSMREFVLWTGSCWGAAKFEIIRLYEIQQRLQCMSYFDVIPKTQTYALGRIAYPLACNMSTFRARIGGHLGT
ncbi:hypothetical protein HDU67_003817 [Dinochytrium kinnereticum]|nr:hypothetical protein HDU67_003817 [Dinochytrium kinnereticum]